MDNSIKHQGIVEEVSKGCVRVRIVQISACAQCQISGHCSASESKVKIINVYTTEETSLHEGDSVTVVATNKSGFIAVILSAVLPMFIVIAGLATVLALTGNEATAALCGIASLLPYYMILYALRGKISRSVSFRLDKGGSDY